MQQVDPVDLLPDPPGSDDGLFFGQVGIAAEIRVGIAECGSAEHLKTFHIPAGDILLIRIHINGKIDEIGYKNRRSHRPHTGILKNVQSLHHHDVGTADPLFSPAEYRR